MSWLEQRFSEIGGLDQRLLSEFGAVGADEMDLKPDAKTWSINECFDHVIQTNRKYYDTFDSIASRTYRIGGWSLLPVVPRLLGKMIVRVVSPEYKGKVKTSPIFYPRESSYGKNLTQELLNENAVLIGKLERFREETLDELVVVSPVSRFVTYSLRDCIRLLVDHEKRHFNQAVSLKSRLAKTG